MFSKVFLVLLSLQYSFAFNNGGDKLYAYEREFRSRVEPIRKMEPFFMEGDRQSSCRPPITCNADYPYRIIPGLCNNLQNPYWGSSLLPFKRCLFPAYGDGVSTPRGDGPNQFLPRPRDVSFPLHNIRDPTLSADDGITLLVMQWGQFVDHDFFFTPEKEIHGCCDDFQTVTTSDPECRALDVTNDPFYEQFGVNCLQFIRSIPVDPSCSGVPYREQQSDLTAYLDASQVYGSTFEQSEELRFNSDPAFLKIGPQNEETCTKICPLNTLPIRSNAEGEPEFFGGDVRVEEQPGLTSMHTIFLRFHNDLAREYRKQYGNSVTSDFIFEEVRRIVSATIQQITYNEFLPIIIGTQAAAARGITILPGETYETIYDPTIDTSPCNVYAAAVYRFGHTLIPDVFLLPNNVQVLLARSFFSHTRTITRGTFPSDFIQGIAANLAQKYDHIMVDAIVNKLFAEAPFNFGSDLLARNIMRAREHGIPGYNAWRTFAGLRNFTSFDQLYGVMADPVVDLFRSRYRSVDDIDLFPALISEYSDGNSLVGPLLRELLGLLFQNLKFGDRFWFESIHQPKPFTRRQLGSIHRTLISSLICAYTDATRVQRYAMYAVSAENPLIDCSEILKDGVINDITLYWV